ncbi:MAG: lipocalin-like domain-containing protein [Pseudomonadota bacterium]
MTRIFGLVWGALLLTLSGGLATAQTAKDLIGTWTLSAIQLELPDKKIDLFGPGAKGQQTFDANGRFSIMIMRSDLPKVASNNRETATPEEASKLAHGTIAYFGTYTANDADKTITVNIESATFPNWNGTSQKRTFSFADGQLTFSNPTTTTGSGVAKIIWKRAP